MTSMSGLCHESCTVSSTVQTSEGVEYMATCKGCYQASAQSENEKNKSPTSPLLLQGQVAASTRILEKHANVKPASLSKSKCNWGLIWRKRKGDNQIGDDFIMRNILHKGNPDMQSLKPKCHLCSQPYDPDLMYIHCESCNCWFHADAVGLQEEKVFELMGFKCCKCRRIKSPSCPYDNKKIFEVKRLRVKGPKLENVANAPSPGSLQEQQDLIPRLDGFSHIANEDPLLISSSEFQPQSENHPEMDYEWNMTTISGPQKLPVRRSSKCEQSEDLFTADGSGYAVTSTSFENPVDELSVPIIEWDVSANGFDDNMMFDFDCLDNEEAGFEPQTYFSFNELLETDDGGSLPGIELSADAAVDWEASNTIQRSELPDLFDDQPRDVVPIDYTTDTIVCLICSHEDPPPDRVCQTCGTSIHSHCSPWVEPPSGGGGWRCGNCREWR